MINYKNNKTGKYNIAVIGATGAVGEAVLKILDEQGFEYNELRLLASSRSAGKVINHRGKPITVQELTSSSFSNIDFAFFVAGGDISKKFVNDATNAGAIVIDNTSAFRMDEGVPLIVPEINGDVLFEGEHSANAKEHMLISNPNCTTIIMLMALKPLHDYAKVKRVIVSSYQAVSGAGQSGIMELLAQTEDWVHGRDQTPPVKFKHPILFNVIPHIDSFTENGYTKEEMKMFNETRKILVDNEIRVSATCVRVPVLTSHSESIMFETEKELSVEKARELLSDTPGVILFDSPEESHYPMPLYAHDTDVVLVGRIRKDISFEHGMSMWVSGDQIRKGAATNAVQIMYKLLKREWHYKTTF